MPHRGRRLFMDIGAVRQVKIDEEMRGAYLDYAMSVIVSRALPDARDGLKPVHRRILFAMWDMGVRANSGYRKSARIVGEVLGKFHPHGDSSVYDAMVRMAQDFSMRYPLIDGQGNFGSLDNDPPAAMRYTEARMQRVAEEMMIDIDAETVDFVPNFDDTLEEPTVLPARLPNLLLNGTSGIAVGMATNIPPHNLREIAAAISYLIDIMVNAEGDDLEAPLEEVTVDDLMQFVKGPDFPTGALMGGAELREIYATGKGRVVIRAKCEIEEYKDGRYRVVVSEIPYQLSKSSILERIAELTREGRLTHINDLRDESDRNGLRIVLELTRDAQPNLILNRLFKYTQLQTPFHVQMLALVDGEPRLLSLKRALQIYIQHRQVVIQRRSEFDLRKARARAHILEGLLAALANLDDIIQTIRNADSAEDARNQLTARFNLTEPQAQAILDMQLRRLAALERQKIEDEYRQVRAQIEYLEDLLASPRKVLRVIQADLNELVDKFGDERRTSFAPHIDAEFDESDLVREEDVLISLTQRGYIKCTSASTYRAQKRGGKGVTGIATRDEDVVQQIFAANTLDYILFFTNHGKVYSLRTFQLPLRERAARGVTINSILPFQPEEKVTAALVVPDFEQEGFFTLCTRFGRIKRVMFEEFSSVRPSGLIAMSLDEGDELRWVRHTSGNDDLLLVTAEGQSIRFSENDVRVMGRPAAGVNAIRLIGGDVLAGVDVISADHADHDLLIVTEYGYGKRTAVSEFRQQGRFGMGIRAIGSDLERTGKVIGAMLCDGMEDATVITVNGITLRTPVSSINRYSRTAMGVRVMNIAEDDAIASVTLVTAEEEEELLAPDDKSNGHGDLAKTAPIDEPEA